MGWFPAGDPHTVCTFNLLHHFHLQTLQLKTTTYGFYGVVVHKTDNTGLQTPKVHPLRSRS